MSNLFLVSVPWFLSGNNWKLWVKVNHNIVRLCWRDIKGKVRFISVVLNVFFVPLIYDAQWFWMTWLGCSASTGTLYYV